MIEVAKKHQDALERIKKNVEESANYFEPNYKRWHEFMKFVFLTSLSDYDIALLDRLKKPQIEFNVLEAYISRLLGEFSKQEPSVKISAANSSLPAGEKTTSTVEGYMRYAEQEARENGCEYEIYKDLLGGGFSVAKVWTDYVNEMSFEQEIKFERAFDPTLCGFDPLARRSDKSDGQYCFELVPKTKDEFQAEFPDIDISDIKFVRSADLKGFNWSYQNQSQKILLIANYYEKKLKQTKIVHLSNGTVMPEDRYKEHLLRWEEAGIIEQAPTIVGKPRMTTITTICRYRFIENKVMSYKKMNFAYLPLVFFDGSSVIVRKDESGAVQQHTRPYVYQAMGIQKLKNFAGQTLANEIENMVQHKFKIPKEGIPQECKEAYTNYQTPSTIVYNQFKDDNPDVRLDPPQEIARVPTPPEVANAFMGSDQVTQSILGSYDAQLGIQNQQLSGVAIVEGATQSNATAMPYIVGFLNGLTQVFTIMLDLIPKYMSTPRTVPTIGIDGKRNYIAVNQQGHPSLQYDPHSLNIRVQAGVNFAIQKSRALQQIIAMSQASPMFGQFINTVGLPIILDNLEIRGIDQLKDLADKFIKQMEAQQARTAQQGQQDNPQLINAQNDRMKIAQEAQLDETNAKLKAAEIAVSNKKADNERLKIMEMGNNNSIKQELEAKKVDAELTGQAVDVAIKAADTDHRHTKESIELAHKIGQPIMEMTEEPGEE